MVYQSFLIKYAEIGTKGNNRRMFEDALCNQIRRVLSKADGDFSLSRESGRIYVKAESDYDYDEVIDALQHVFGILWICPMFQTAEKDYEALKQTVVNYIDEVYSDKHFTFKVHCRRADKSYPVHSEQMNCDLGDVILRNFPETRVDVHHPQVLLEVEVRRSVNIYSQNIPGPGGMPLGTNGKAMLLLSGGIDSPVAGYLTAKRGVRIEAVYFHAPPYTSERARQKVIDLAREVAAYSGPIRLHIINFTEIQLYIYDKCPHEELTVIMRRYMMRIAETLSRGDGCLALVTGESIGQVASQTVAALASTDEVATQPVFRPLISFDKQEIISVAEKIGTYETSILPYEDCCTIFVAKHPVINPKLERIHASEAKLEGIEEMVQKALENDEVIVCE